MMNFASVISMALCLLTAQALVDGDNESTHAKESNSEDMLQTRQLASELTCSGLSTAYGEAVSSTVPKPTNYQSRATWGAKPYLSYDFTYKVNGQTRSTNCGCDSPSSMTNPSKITIHHTASYRTNTVNQVQEWHQGPSSYLKGCDVGYHFLIGYNGIIYQGRAFASDLKGGTPQVGWPSDLKLLLGAHVGGANTNNIGISLIGCFDDNDCSSAMRTSFDQGNPQYEALTHLVAFLSETFGFISSTSTIKYHRQFAPSNACPGSRVINLYSSIIDDALAKMVPCYDNPKGWYDSNNHDCSWYAQNNRCAIYGISYENFGQTANEACCACNGGSSTDFRLTNVFLYYNAQSYPAQECAVSFLENSIQSSRYATFTCAYQNRAGDTNCGPNLDLRNAAGAYQSNAQSHQTAALNDLQAEMEANQGDIWREFVAKWRGYLPCTPPSNDLNSLGISGCSRSNPCSLCQGDCDSDADCAGSLKCFQRRDSSAVPGCTGTGVRAWDYCYDPSSSTTTTTTTYAKGKIVITMDRYPWETSFEILTPGGINVVSEDNFEGSGSTHTFVYNLGGFDKYQFILKDSYGDGFDGSVSIYGVNADGSQGIVLLNYNGPTGNFYEKVLSFSTAK